MPFTMLFEGLICHIGPDADQKTHAALVSDPDTHKAMLKYNSDEPIPLFKGDRIVFDTGQGTARTTQHFKERVPSLQPLIPGGYTIESKVLGAVSDPIDKALAYILFPDGELDAPEVAFRPIDFVGPNDLFLTKRCVAKGVRFKADANATLSIIFSGSVRKSYTLTDADVIRIRNVSSGAEGHFHLYRGLTTSPVFGAAKADENRRCKPEKDFDEGSTLFPDKTEALIEGARQRQELSGAWTRTETGKLQAQYSPDDPTTSQDADANKIEILTVPHAECSNSNWP